MPNVIGWSGTLWARFGIVATLVLLVPWALCRFFGLNLLTGITGMTALILVAYTIETQALRLEVVRQNELAIQPLLIAAAEPREGRIRFVLRNIGRGAALFIQTQDVVFPEAGGVQTVARFSKVDYISPGKDAVVISEHTHEGRGGEILEGPREGRWADPFAYHIDRQSSPRDYEITILYEDINGERRYSVMMMGRSGTRLLRHGKA